jgi:hypothetical protein
MWIPPRRIIPVKKNVCSIFIGMKIIITESQFGDLAFRRRIPSIVKLVDENMSYYHPCDYVYDGGFNDYFTDVCDATIREIIINDLKLNWADDMEKIDNLWSSLDNPMKEMFKDKARTYFYMIIEDGCNDDDY